MTTTRRLSLAYLALMAGVAVLFALNLFWGSVAISPRDVVQALLGRGQDELAANILLQLRLPRAVMVVLLGAALSVAGYLLQTFFANPIAGPYRNFACSKFYSLVLSCTARAAPQPHRRAK